MQHAELIHKEGVEPGGENLLEARGTDTGTFGKLLVGSIIVSIMSELFMIKKLEGKS